MDANFNVLLNRYIENQASAEEEKEFMRLLRHGANQEQLDRYFDSMLKEPARVPMFAEERAEVRAAIMERINAEPRQPAKVSPARAWLAVAACLIPALSVSFWLYKDGKQVPEPLSITETVYHGRDFVLLPDGSTVMLNDNSELKFTYASDRREVELNGEAYFDVAFDHRKPFYVRTGKLLTKVLGTSFSIRAYRSQKEYQVAVTRGRVQVSDDTNSRSYGVLTPDEQLAVNPQTEAVVKTASKKPSMLSWRDTFFILNDVSLEKAGKLIYERYRVNIKFKNPALAKCEVHAKFFHDEKIETVLDVITSALNLTYVTEENGDVVIDGDACL